MNNDELREIAEDEFHPFGGIAEELLLLRGCDKWVPYPVAPGFMPERNAHVLYWHKSGYFAFADEWRDDQHGQIATHWWRLPPIPEKP